VKAASVMQRLDHGAEFIRHLEALRMKYRDQAQFYQAGRAEAEVACTFRRPRLSVITATTVPLISPTSDLPPENSNCRYCHVAFKHSWGFQAESDWNNHLALQAFSKFERLFRDAREAFAAEIFGNALGWQHFGLFEQTHRDRILSCGLKNLLNPPP
jgi:hypothetical protein